MLSPNRSSSRPSLARRLLAGLVLALAACASVNNDEAYAKMTNDALYAQAKGDLDNGNWDPAIKALDALEARAAGTALAPQALLGLAWAHYKSDEHAEALVAVDRFIRQYPASQALDYAYYLKGLINFNEGTGLFAWLTRDNLADHDQAASRESWQAFKELVDRFPQSRYAPDARLRMTYIVNALATYGTNVARFYYERGAYVAAANRAQQVVTDFPTAPATELALAVMAQSYDKLGLDALEKDATRVLQRSFPDSPYLTAPLQPRQQAWWHLW